MGFRVTEEERKLIYQRMGDIGFPNVRSYLLKMALNGYIINVDLADVRECSRLLRKYGDNVNQIAKRVNQTGNIFAADIADIKAGLDAIWQQQEKILKNLIKMVEAV